MYAYPVELLKSTITEIIKQQVNEATWNWLKQQEPVSSQAFFNQWFVLIPRKTGKSSLHLSQAQEHSIEEARPGFSTAGYTIDRLCRIWLLLQVNNKNEEEYFRRIDNLFSAADVNEGVALYGALPLLSFPEKWIARCAEGIRSNIGVVLETIICNNPYPCEYLSESAWNQLVLKAFFTEKDIDKIIGLEKRANRTLAIILCDYAHERWAASRTVHPQLWRCVAPFIDAQNFIDIQKVAASENILEQQAALLACYGSFYGPAKALLNAYPKIREAIVEGTLNWHSLEKQAPAIL